MSRYFLLIICVFFSIQVFAENKWSGIFNAGIEDFNKGQYDFSINNFKKFLILSNDQDERPKALYYLGVSYYFLEQPTQARQYFDELISRYKLSESGGQAHFWLGLIYQNEQRWEEAEKEFLRFVMLMPHADLVDSGYLAAGNALYEQKKYREAIQTLGILVTNPKSKKFEEASVLYAYLLIQLKQYDDAKKFLEEWLNRIASSKYTYTYKDRFWLYLAEVYLINNDDEKAYGLLKKIDTEAMGTPSHAIALFRLSEIEFRRGYEVIALEYINRLSVEFPKSFHNFEASYMMALRVYSNGRYNDARKLLERLLNQLDELDVIDDKEQFFHLQEKARLYVAECYLAEGLYDEAANNFNQLVNEQDLALPEAVVRLAFIYASQNKIDLLKKIIEKHSTHIGSTNYKDEFAIYEGTYYAEIGEYVRAYMCIEAIDHTNPLYFNSLSLRINLALKEGKIELAESLLREKLAKTSASDKATQAVALMSINLNMKNYGAVLQLVNLMPVYLRDALFSQKELLQFKSYFFKGVSYMQMQEYNKGVAALEPIFSYKGRNHDIVNIVASSYYFLGWMKYKLSLFDEASLAFARVSVIHPGSEYVDEAGFMEAMAFYSAGKFGEASVRFSNYASLNKGKADEVRALFYMGKSLYNQGKLNEAYMCHFSIVKNFPTSPYARDSSFELISHAFAIHDIEQAHTLINEFGRKWKKDPLYAGALIMQMEYFLAQERYSEALTSALGVISIFPEHEQIDMIYYRAALSAQKVKDYDTAAKFYIFLSENFASSSYHEDALIELIELYHLQKEYNNELVTINKYENTFYKTNDYSQRKIILQKIMSGVSDKEATLQLQAEAGDMGSLFELAVLTYKKGELNDGIKMLKKVQNTDRGVAGAKANNFLADIDFNIERYREALRLYATTISKYKADNSTNEEALYKSAYCYYTLGSHQQAIKLLNTLKEKYPTSKWGPNADALLRSMQ